MGSVISTVFGGGSSSQKKVAKSAENAQALAREQQNIAQARQVSSTADETARTALIRRNPRGRRLLADQSPSGLSTTVA